MNAKYRQITKFFCALILVSFWTEYLTGDVRLALTVGLLSALLTLRLKKDVVAEENFRLAFNDFTAFYHESQQNYLHRLYPDGKETNGLIIHENVAYKMAFSFDKIPIASIVEWTKTAAEYAAKLVIYSANLNVDKIKNLTPIKIEVRQEKQLINELKAVDALPDIPQNFLNARRNMRATRRSARAGYLLLSALSVAVSSLFSPLKLYLLIWASVLTVLALLTAILPTKKQIA